VLSEPQIQAILKKLTDGRTVEVRATGRMAQLQAAIGDTAHTPLTLLEPHSLPPPPRYFRFAGGGGDATAGDDGQAARAGRGGAHRDGMAAMIGRAFMMHSGECE
jgi:hypothetical protein